MWDSTEKFNTTSIIIHFTFFSILALASAMLLLYGACKVHKNRKTRAACDNTNISSNNEPDSQTFKAADGEETLPVEKRDLLLSQHKVYQVSVYF